MGTRAFDAAIVDLRCAGYCTGEADATRGSGQTYAYPWSGGVDDHRGAVERAWAARAHLVASYSTAPSSSTVRGLAQAAFARCDPPKERCMTTLSRSVGFLAACSFFFISHLVQSTFQFLHRKM